MNAAHGVWAYSNDAPPRLPDDSKTIRPATPPVRMGSRGAHRFGCRLAWIACKKSAVLATIPRAFRRGRIGVRPPASQFFGNQLPVERGDSAGPFLALHLGRKDFSDGLQRKETGVPRL